ncbi:hypothetical protein A2U01_0075717, partial [Trifolium medium]|nr:hypothetical protein [Trifolium medium]
WLVDGGADLGCGEMTELKESLLYSVFLEVESELEEIRYN